MSSSITKTIGKKLMSLLLALIMVAGFIPGGLITPHKAHAASSYTVGSVVDMGSPLGLQTVTQVVEVTASSTHNITGTNADVIVLWSNGEVYRTATINISGSPIIILDNVYVRNAAAATNFAIVSVGITASDNPIFYIPDGTTNGFMNYSTYHDYTYCYDAGILLLPAASLTIYGGPEASGMLSVKGSMYSSAIGGIFNSSNNMAYANSGKVYIYGGTLFLSCDYASAIGGAEGGGRDGPGGGGMQSGSGNTVVISGNANIYTFNRISNGGYNSNYGNISYGSDVTITTTGTVWAGLIGRQDTASGGGNNVFDSGNVIPASSAGALISPNQRPKNSQGETLYLQKITVVNKAGARVGGADLTVVVHPGNVGGTEYTYTARTYNNEGSAVLGAQPNFIGVAWLWLPAGATYTILAEHEDWGGNDVQFTQAANDTGATTITLDPTLTATLVNTGKIYLPNTDTINLTAINSGIGSVPKTIASTTTWFREPMIGNTNTYDKTTFDAAYGAAAGVDKGSVAMTGDDSQKTGALTAVNKNGVYWFKCVMTYNGHDYTQVIKLVVDNLYTPVNVYYTGIDRGDNETLYAATKALGANTLDPQVYGIPYDFGGNTAADVIVAPSNGYDTINLTAKSLLPLWSVNTSPGNPERPNLPLNAAFFSLSPAVGINNFSSPYVFSYDKVPSMWGDVTLMFVDQLGNPLTVDHPNLGHVTSEIIPDFAPIGYFFNTEGLKLYTPPPAVNTIYTVQGYRMSDTLGTPPSTVLQSISFPNGFNPKVPRDNYVIYIVYDSGLVEVTEQYRDITGGLPGTAITGASDTVMNIAGGYRYEQNPAPPILNYVCVGYQIDGGTPVYTGPANPSYNAPQGKVVVIVDPVTVPVTVTYLYKLDLNNNGIPDDEEATVTLDWTGVRLDGTTLSLKSTQTLNGRLGLSTNPSNGGNIITIVGTAPVQWLFDKSVTNGVTSGGAAPAVTFGTDNAVVFYYDIDSQGIGTPDKDQRVMEKYMLENGSPLSPPVSDTFTYSLWGSTYTKTAPAQSGGYMAIGWYKGTYTGVETYNKITETNRTVVADFINTQTDDTVTFIYAPAAQPATVTWEGDTNSGTHVLLHTRVINGYIGETLTVNRSDAGLGTEWVNATGEELYNSESITLSGTAQSFEFNFKEHKVSSVITVVGVSTDGTLNFSTQQTVSITAAPFVVNALEGFYGYRVDGYIAEDIYGNIIASYTLGNSVTVDPALGDQTITFTYVSTITTLTIKAVDKNNPSTVLFEEVITDLIIGQTYAAIAPFIDDTWVLDGTVLREVTITSGANIVTFEYEQIVGDVTVILREVDSAGTPVSPAHYMRVLVMDANPVLGLDIDPTAYLSADYFTPYDSTPVHVNWNASHQTVYLDYVKDLIDVLIVPVDQSSSLPIVGESKPAPSVRKGEMFTATAHTVPGYTLMESPSKQVYADPTTDPVEVEFLYKKDVTGKVNINHYYLDGATKVYLSKSIVTLIEEAKLTVMTADYAYPGFSYTGTYTLNGTSYTGDTAEFLVRISGDTVEFLYTDIRLTLTVKTELGTDPATVHHEEKIVSGDSRTLYPPYFQGYVATYYTVDANPPVAISSGFTGYLTGPVTTGLTLTWHYETLEDVVNADYLSVTVRGVTGALTHYSYVRRIAKTELPYTLTDGIDVFTVPGYTLDGGQNHLVTDGTYLYTFNYTSTDGVVRITLKEQGTGNLLGSFNVPATVGSPFTYLAPAVGGYYLTSTSNIGYVGSVAAGGASEIIFEYAKVTSKVTVTYIEDGTTDVIRVVEITSPVTGTPTLINPPATLPGYYTLKSGEATKTYTFDGTNAVNVDVYYVKDLVSIPITAVDDVTGADLGAQSPLTNRRQGEVVSVPAPVISGYTLIGEAPRLVLATGSTVTFRYRNNTSGGVIVNVYAGSISSASLLQTYTIPANNGDTVTVDPLSITVAGYSYLSTTGERLSVTAGNGEDIIVIMQDNRLTLTVQTKEGTSPAATHISWRLPSPYTRTVYAPYLPGYILTGYQIDGGTPVTAGTINEYSFSAQSAAHIITFLYMDEDDYIDGKFGLITVIASDGTSTLSQATTLVKTGGNVIVTAPDLPGWVLDSAHNANYQNGDGTGTFGKGTVDTSVSGPYSYTFYYTKNTRDVYVDALFSGSSLGGYPLKISSSTVGEVLNIYAPVIPGYELASSEPLSRTHTVAAGTTQAANTVSFTYVKSQGNVLFQYVDEVTGNVLIQLRENVDTGTSTTALIPTAGHNTVLGTLITSGAWELKGGDGTPSASNSTVGTNIVITFTLSPVTRNITVKYLKQGTADPVATATAVTGVQVGKTLDVLAVPTDLLPGWVLTGNPYQSYTVLSGTNEVTFYYADRSLTGAGAVTVIGYSGGKVIYYNVGTPLSVGASYGAVTVPGVTGYKNGAWRNTSDPVSGTMPGSGVTVIFDYDIDLVSIPVYVRDTSSNPLPGLIYENSTLNLYKTLTVQRGSDLTVTAPFIPDWAISDGITDYSFTGLTGTETATFTYKLTAGTVTITLKEQGTGTVLDTFSVPATIGAAFTFLAPAVDLYRLTSTSNIGTVSSVAADGTSEIVFEYARILSKVTVTYIEDGTTDVIRVVEVSSPVIGTATLINPPATLPGYYTLKSGEGTKTYLWNGTDTVNVNVYYTKDLVDIAVKAVDDKGVANLSAYNTVLNNQRRGEAVSITAPVITGYVLVGDSPRLVIADGTDVTFRYRSDTASDVLVKVYDDNKTTGELLLTYTIPATLGDPVTVNPATVTVAGYSYDSGAADNLLSVTAGSGHDIIVIMRDNRLTVTVKTDTAGTAVTHSTEKVVSGESRTLYPPYIYGYIATEYGINGAPAVAIPSTFTGYATGSLTADLEITWYYETVAAVYESTMATITVNYEMRNGNAVPGKSGFTRQLGLGASYAPTAGEILATDAVLVDWKLNGTLQGNTAPLISSVSANATITLVYGQDKNNDGTEDFTVTVKHQTVLYGDLLPVSEIYVNLGGTFTGAPSTALTSGIYTNVGYQWDTNTSTATTPTDPVTVSGISDHHTVIFFYSPNNYPITVTRELKDSTLITGEPNLSASVAHAANFNLSAAQTAVSGMSLVNWKLDGVLQNNTAVSLTNVTGFHDIVLIYDDETYTVSYDGNGSTSGSVSAQSGLYGTVLTLRGNAFLRDGYTFTGWNTASGGSGTSYSGSGTMTVTGNVTLYAQWVPSSSPSATVTKTVTVTAPGRPTVVPINPPATVTTTLSTPSVTVTAPSTAITTVTAPPVTETVTSPVTATVTTTATDVGIAPPATVTLTVTSPPPGSGDKDSWALLNLILCILGGLTFIISIIRMLLGRHQHVNFLWLLITAVLAIIGIIVFCLTEDMSLRVALADIWTLLNFVLLALGVLSMLLIFKRKDG